MFIELFGYGITILNGGNSSSASSKFSDILCLKNIYKNINKNTKNRNIIVNNIFFLNFSSLKSALSKLVILLYLGGLLIFEFNKLYNLSSIFIFLNK